MRIAHIVCTYPPYYGGMGNVVFQTAHELVKLGHEVEVYTPQYMEAKEIRSAEAPPARTHAPEIEERIDYATRLTPTLAYGNAARIPEVTKELDQFDIVHLHYPFFGTANLVRKWKLRHPDRPLVITYHMDTRGPGWKDSFLKSIVATGCRKFSTRRISSSRAHLILSRQVKHVTFTKKKGTLDRAAVRR